MNDNSKCFIKIGNKVYEEITIEELKRRKNNLDTYNAKKFIPIQRKIVRGFNRGI